MKIIARFSSDNAATRVLMGVVVALALWGCERTDSRVADPELVQFIETIKPSPAQSQDTAICAALPTNPGGVIVIQEITENRSVVLAFRYGEDEATDGAMRYTVKSLQIRTSPSQISWNIRLEEEMENWVATVTPDKQPERTTPVPQEPILSIEDESPGLAKERTDLNIFKNAIATALGSLHMLKAWCESKKAGQGENPARLHLDLPGKPSLVLQTQNADVRIISGDTHLTFSPIIGGVQAVRSHPPKKASDTINKHQVILTVLSAITP